MDVLASTRRVMEHARMVRIDDAAIERWSAAWRPMVAAAHASPLDDVRGTREQIANLILLADALNFCFWANPGQQPISTTWRGRPVERYMAFAAALAAAVTEDPRWLEA